MEYKIKPVELKADVSDGVESGVTGVSFPELKDRVIVKSGQDVEFTMRAVEQNVANLNKIKKEVEPILSHANAKIENVEHHHPIVKTLTGEQVVAVRLYSEATEAIIEAEAKLKEVDTILEATEIELVEIRKQIPELLKLDEAEKEEVKKKTNGKTTKK